MIRAGQFVTMKDGRLYGRSLKDRILGHIERIPIAGCWILMLALDQQGYPQIDVKVPVRKNIKGHRASWIVHRGPVPDGMCVLHRCDVRCCVNPDHLFLGTVADNYADMRAKGRHAHGKTHGTFTKPESFRTNKRRNVRRKLTEEQVIAIRSDPRTHREIAAHYGCDKARVSRIKSRKVWAWLP